MQKCGEDDEKMGAKRLRERERNAVRITVSERDCQREGT
jgi:hypothetical protein